MWLSQPRGPYHVHLAEIARRVGSEPTKVRKTGRTPRVITHPEGLAFGSRLFPEVRHASLTFAGGSPGCSDGGCGAAGYPSCGGPSATYGPSAGSVFVRVARRVTATVNEPRENVFVMTGR